MPSSRRTPRRRKRLRADMESAPTTNGGPAAKRENRGPAVISDLCRGRCSHRPGNPAARQGPAGGPWPSPTNHGERPAKWEGHTPPGGRRAGCPHPAAPRGGGNTRGRDKSLPYKPWRTPGQMAPPPAAAFTAAGGVPIYGVVVTGNVKTVIRRPAALRGPARRCGS